MNFPLPFTSFLLGWTLAAVAERSPNLYSIIGILPLLWLLAKSRKSAFLTLFAFHLALAHDMIFSTHVFFIDGSILHSFALWILASALNAAPWAVCWSCHCGSRKAMGLLCAIAISILPPLGFIGWGNPLPAAGLLFPAWGWGGLAALLLIYVLCAYFSFLNKIVIVLFLLVSFFLHLPPLSLVSEKVTVEGVSFYGMNTFQGQSASGSNTFDPAMRYDWERRFFRSILEKKQRGEFSDTDIVVMPETVMGRIFPVMTKRWDKFFQHFAKDGVTFILGAEIPTRPGFKYNNVMTSFQADGQRQISVQRFPAPISMYRPFSRDGANGYITSFGDISTMQIHGLKLGFLICYEQLLTWPFLSLLSQNPDVIIAPANFWFCYGTTLPGIRDSSLFLWCRLFGIPLVSSVNVPADGKTVWDLHLADEINAVRSFFNLDS